MQRRQILLALAVLAILGICNPGFENRAEAEKPRHPNATEANSDENREMRDLTPREMAEHAKMAIAYKLSQEEMKQLLLSAREIAIEANDPEARGASEFLDENVFTLLSAEKDLIRLETAPKPHPVSMYIFTNFGPEENANILCRRRPDGATA